MSPDSKSPVIHAARRDTEHSARGSGSPAKAEVTAADIIRFSDTVVFQHRVVTLEEAHRERQRILDPASSGEAGNAYKVLRTQVMYRLRELKTNALGIFSPSGGEGRTLTAINLAIAIAADFNHTALLVDLDLRRPSIHHHLGFEPETGIEDCLQEGSPVFECMVKIDGYQSLTVMPARAPVAQSSELIASQRAGELVQELRARYQNRIVIFDLPPILASDDALAFSRYLQAGLLVVAEGKTERSKVSRAVELLGHLMLVGTVLNASDDRGRAAY